MAIKASPSDAASRYVTGMTNATEKIRAGVTSVTVSPMEKAASAKAKMLANLTQAVNDGKWERGLKSVSLDQWKALFLEKGLPRIAGGATAAEPKMVEYFTKAFPLMNTLLTKIEAMPNTTLDQSIARSAAWIRGMASLNF